MRGPTGVQWPEPERTILTNCLAKWQGNTSGTVEHFEMIATGEMLGGWWKPVSGRSAQGTTVKLPQMG